MLNDFLLENAPLYVPTGRLIINNIKKKIMLYKRENMPVIFACDAHDEKDKEFNVWPKHCIMNTRGAEIIDEFKPLTNEIIVKKRRYSAFFKTNLEEILLKNEVDLLEITGILTHICVLYTSADAAFRDFQVLVTKNCVASNDPFLEEFAFKQMIKVHNITVINE